MTYKVELDVYPQAESGGYRYIASVESTAPTERVLLRNHIGNLLSCRDAIGEAITKHALNPWGEAVARP